MFEQFSYLIFIAFLSLIILTLWKQRNQVRLQLEFKAREVEELSQLKTVCLQAVAHDLRTSIMGMLMILKTLDNQAEQPISLSSPLLRQMIKSSDRALTLINAVSDGLNCHISQINIQRQSLVLKDLIQSILVQLNKHSQANQINIQNLIPTNLPNVKADPKQLKRVLEQLILNAIQHNPIYTKITINADVQADKIYCTITDNGKGMSVQQRQALFKLYVRSLYNSRLTGIGLGLYLCHKIINAHGGEIGVNTQLNVGTKVWFTLPLFPK